MRRHTNWDIEDVIKLKDLAQNSCLTWPQIGKELNRESEACRSKYRSLTGSAGKSYAFTPIAESPYPKYNSPLEQMGDCLILPYPEFPYHNADFINRCLDLAYSWKIKQCCIAGDAMHFNSISKFEANWRHDNGGDLSDKAHRELMDFLPRLPSNLQGEYLATLEGLEPVHDDDIGGEVAVAKQAFLNLSSVFDDVVYVIGNHDGRLLSALNSPMFADQLKQFAVGNNPKYRIAPFYYSILHTDAGDYRISHPVSASGNTAVSLAGQFQMHVIMGHSHNYSRLKDASGKYWAIQAGCTVDEERLAYCSQRDRGSKRHVLGAVIVRGGYPYDLSVETPWNTWKRIT